MESRYPRQERLIEVLHERHISQREFAEMIGMQMPVLSRKLNGHRQISVDEALRIAEALGGTVEELFVGGAVLWKM